MSKPCVTGVCFPVSYVDDYEKALAFYTQVLGLKQSLVLAEDQCFLRVGNVELGLLLAGGHKPHEKKGAQWAQASYVLRAASAPAMMACLREAGAKILQDEPIKTGDCECWFQFFDPAGNLLQILGGK